MNPGARLNTPDQREQDRISAFALRVSDFGFRISAFPPLGLLVAGGCVVLSVLRPAPMEAAAVTPYSIVVSKHNLSVSGPGSVHAATEGDVCIFCHAPHSKTGQTPLWNHEMSSASYTPYTSSTLKATVGQPTGASKLCLSCHDGTVALGMVRNRSTPIRMLNSTGPMPVGRSRLGTDLTGHHPISFTYDNALVTADGELRDPATLQQQVRLDRDKQVQCTSCHDPHRDQYGKFLVKDNSASALCLDCHTPKFWNNSAHATSSAAWNGSGKNPWPHTSGKTVAANACENCHTPHAAGTKPRLLNFDKPEDNCLVCHNGAVATKNLVSEFNKASVHPVLTTASLHDAAEGPMNPGSRHASCVDCHNPHATAGGAAKGTGLSGALARVKGESIGGASLALATHEYEICFRCHAETAKHSSSTVVRQFYQANTRLQFNPGNASYHPVVAAVKTAQSRTLVSTWSGAQQMVCTDCHNNDQGPGAKGTGPNGPHGSLYAPLLERNLNQVDFQPESASAYALCYKCHSQSVLMADRLHSKHVRDQQTACSTCHDAHGVQTQPHLINFNTLYVTPASGRIAYTDQGGGHSTCTLTCHGSSHNNKAY
jgi:predicted CXXCH cytochrome family protein